MSLLRRLANLLGVKTSDAPQRVDPPKATHQAGPPKPAPAACNESDAGEILRQINAETNVLDSERRDLPNVGTSRRWIALKQESPDVQVAVAWTAYLELTNRSRPRTSAENAIWRETLTRALKRDLPFQAMHLHQLLSRWLENAQPEVCSKQTLVGAVERFAARQSLPPMILSALEVISGRIKSRSFSDRPSRLLAERIDRLLHSPGTQQEALPDGLFTSQLKDWIGKLPPEEQEPWLSLAALCAGARNKGKPSGKWLKQARQAIDAIGVARVSDGLIEFLDTFLVSIADDSNDVLKGFCWAMILVDRRAVAGPSAKRAEDLFFRVPSVGNAIAWALSQMVGEPRAAAELFRLRQDVKQHAARKTLDKCLDEFAAKSGMTLDELEDVSLPSFDLDRDSRLTLDFDGPQLTLTLDAFGVTQQWANAAGKPVKAPPAGVRDEYDFAYHRRLVKDIDTARKAQLRRIEQAWIEERVWTFADWQKHFLDHPLRRPIVATLIWQIADKAVMLEGEALTDLFGNSYTFGPNDSVSLWHPLTCDPDEVLAWRARILERGLTQPIRQAHREIYVLTDAERATRTYSNRFAAHILSQHQFKALCHSRGWRFNLLGEWDGHNVPTRTLRKQSMTLEYHVETLDGGGTSYANVALYLSSDRVRFFDDKHQGIELERITPIVFSEAMRDVDLFVAVTSVANDPNWSDGGPEGQFRDYWQEMAAADLGQRASTRKELIGWLAPKLSIADKLEVTEKFLVVTGKKQKYAIHFGSSTIQILPSNRYLCIVPNGAPKEVSKLKLPFTGDSLLSIILSKAFLLADESKITDESILRQL